MVKYVCDAWGNHDVLDAEGKIVDRTASVIANINPFRYRGYYFDVETGLYYLQTRYYDPETGRFISPDDVSYLDPEIIQGLNLFAYCLNNPAMYTDSTGTFWSEIGNWFKKVANDIKNFFVEDVYGGIIKPVIDCINNTATEVGNWIGAKVIQPIGNFNNVKTYYNHYNTNKSLAVSLPDGGPYIDPDAEGWGENGEFTVFQKVMGIIAAIGAGIGLIGVIVCFVPVPGARVVGLSMFGIGFAIAIIALAIGGLGGAT